MKFTIKKKLAVGVVSTLAAIGLMAAGGAGHAIGEGQIEQGDIYRIKNITKNSLFADPASADKCETVQYKVRLHNPGPGVVSNVNVKATLPTTAASTNVSTVSITAQNAFPVTVSDIATLFLSTPQSVSYVSGSTQLLDTNSAVLANLPDGIIGSGVNIGSVAVSLLNIKFVQFQAKVNCPPPPAQPVFTCDKLSVLAQANRMAQVSAFATTALNGAVYNHAVIDWGDGSAPLTIASPVGQTHQYAADGTYTITATAHFIVNGQDVAATSPACVAKVTFKAPPVTPVYTCDKLSVVAQANRTAQVTAFAATAAGGATFTNAVINWGDGSTPLTSASPVGQTHQYAADGTYTITATAHFNVNGQDVTATSPACMQQVTFKTVVPVYTCDKLSVVAETPRTARVTAFATTASGGAVFKNAVIDWGDNSTPLTIANPVGQIHQYAVDGTYTITATAHFTLNGQDVTATSPACVAKVTVNTPVTPVYTCDKLNVMAQANRTANITAFATTATGGAVFKNVVIDWGDNSTPLTIASPVGQTHQYAADGTYTVTATAHFTVNGQDVTASGPNCVKYVTFETPVTPIYLCNKFSITADAATRTIKVSGFAVTATNGAVFKNVVIDWGDVSSPLTIVDPIGQTHQYSQDGTFSPRATAHFTLNGQDVTATSPDCVQQVTFVAKPQPPVYTCDKLSVSVDDATRTATITNLTTTATNGAVLKNVVIDWGDNTTPLTNANVIGQSHQYANSGSFTITATAHFIVAGQDVTATSPACTQYITIKTPPVTPVYTCDKLNISSDASRLVTVTNFDTTASGGAVFKNVVIDWGDNSTALTTANAIGQTHQYAADGTYTITATAHFTVNSQDVTATSPGCVQKVTFKAPPVVVYTCDKFTISSNIATRTVNVTAFATTATGGATFTNAVIDWGDGTAPLTSANPVGQSHQYATDGTFSPRATAHFSLNGADVTASGPSCVQKVDFKTPPVAVYTCDKLAVATEDVNRKVKVTTLDTTATNGAVLKNVVIDWGDNTTPLTTNTPVGQTHQYGQDGTFTITATANFTLNGQDVSATSEACTAKVTFKAPPQTPVYTCDKLSVTTDNNRLVTISNFANTATNGAVLKNVVIDWGDSSTALTTTNAVGQTHQYAKDKDGTFTITATAHFMVDGKDVTATGPQCTQMVTFKTNTPPVVTTPPSTPVAAPTTLVNTGPGSTAALFALVAVVGTLAHRYFLGRRLGSNL